MKRTIPTREQTWTLLGKLIPRLDLTPSEAENIDDIQFSLDTASRFRITLTNARRIVTRSYPNEYLKRPLDALVDLYTQWKRENGHPTYSPPPEKMPTMNQPEPPSPTPKTPLRSVPLRSPRPVAGRGAGGEGSKPATKKGNILVRIFRYLNAHFQVDPKNPILKGQFK